MNARELSQKIDIVIATLIKMISRHESHAAFGFFFQELQRTSLDSIPSVDVLNQIFSVRYEATIGLKNPDAEENNQISPLFVYCKENEIDVATHTAEFIDFYCQVIKAFHLLLRQKYLLRKIDDGMETGKQMYDQVLRLNAEYLDQLMFCKKLPDNDHALVYEFDLVLHRVATRLQREGYESAGWPFTEIKERPRDTPLTSDVDQWLHCLTDEKAHRLGDKPEPFPSRVKQVKALTQTSLQNGNRVGLYDCQTEAILKSVRMRVIAGNLGSKINAFLEHLDELLETRQKAKQLMLEFSARKRAMLVQINKTTSLVATMRKSVYETGYGLLELHQAMKAVYESLPSEDEEIKVFTEFHTEIKHFVRRYFRQKEEIKRLNECTRLFIKYKKENEESRQLLEKKIAPGRTFWAACGKMMYSLAEEYLEVTPFDLPVYFRQIALNNWRWAVLGGVLLAGAAAAVGVFLFALSALYLTLAITGGLIAGAGLFFGAAIKTDYARLPIKPELAKLEPLIDSFHCRLPDNKQEVKYEPPIQKPNTSPIKPALKRQTSLPTRSNILLWTHPENVEPAASQANTSLAERRAVFSSVK
jgi:hypothetical protein